MRDDLTADDTENRVHDVINILSKRRSIRASRTPAIAVLQCAGRKEGQTWDSKGRRNSKSGGRLKFCATEEHREDREPSPEPFEATSRK